MKIIHVCITSPFTDGLSYQENELVEQHVLMGHEVTVIASTETYNEEKLVVHTYPGTSCLECGAKLIRLPYFLGIKGWLATKVRAHHGLRECLESLNPDSILFHGLSAWGLITVSRFVRRFPKVKLFADCHEDFTNSASTWASRELLHKCFYIPIFKSCVDQISEVLCVNLESLDFAVHFYGAPPSKSTLYPMGGIIDSPAVNASRRAKFRETHGFTSESIVITQTGKLNASKKLVEAISAFRSNPSPLLNFVIAGTMSEDVKVKCLPMIQSDNRIINLGWQSKDELRTVFSGADYFLQPYGQTVSTQMAMCQGCVVLAQDLPSHRWLIGKNGRLFKDFTELEITFDWVVSNHHKLEQLRSDSLRFAEKNLDYRLLAMKIAT